MKQIFIISFVFTIAIIPIFAIRRKYFRSNIFLGRFIGNYIFILHYMILLLIMFSLINLFFPLNKFYILILGSIITPIVFLHAYFNFSIAKIIENKIVLNKYNLGKNIKIAFISDVHLSALTNKNNIVKSLVTLTKEKPDIILVGGDFIDYSCRDIKANFEKTFRAIEPKYGIYAILGNHEYFGDIEENINYIKSLGIKILRDEVIQINGLNIIGRDSIINEQRKATSALKLMCNENFPTILVDHNPNSIKESIANNIDLQLSGHTHKGQIFPYNLVVSRLYDNSYGHKKFNDTHTIVSAGFSSWLIPYRVNSTSEINIIKLKY